MNKILLLVLFQFIVMGASAKETKSSPSQFAQCANHFNQRAIIRNQQRKAKSRASKMNATRSRLESEIDTHETEVNRLDKILKIMRSSDSVRNKRRNAYNRYKRAFNKYDTFMVKFRKERSLYTRNSKKIKKITSRINASCVGSWKTNLIRKYCNNKQSKYAKFCASF